MLIDAASASYVKEIFGVETMEGQKVSRVINTICHKYGFNKHPEYNELFCKISDQLNLSEKQRGVAVMTQNDYNIINQIFVCVGEIVQDSKNKQNIFIAVYNAGKVAAEKNRQNLQRKLEDLHLEGLKVEAVLNAITNHNCKDCDMLVSVASDRLDQMLANLELTIYKCAVEKGTT